MKKLNPQRGKSKRKWSIEEHKAALARYRELRSYTALSKELGVSDVYARLLVLKALYYEDRNWQDEILPPRPVIQQPAAKKAVYSVCSSDGRSGYGLVLAETEEDARHITANRYGHADEDQMINADPELNGKHLSATHLPNVRKCINCMYWSDSSADYSDFGACHLNPPSMDVLLLLQCFADGEFKDGSLSHYSSAAEAFHYWSHPCTRPEDWCGSWKAAPGTK
jgi:hypothetical protein